MWMGDQPRKLSDAGRDVLIYLQVNIPVGLNPWPDAVRFRVGCIGMFLALPLTQQRPLVFWVMLALMGETLRRGRHTHAKTCVCNGASSEDGTEAERVVTRHKLDACE